MKQPRSEQTDTGWVFYIEYDGYKNITHPGLVAYEKGKSSCKNLPCVQSSIFLAEEMGKSMGRGKVL